jgi:hypothetical protein
MSYTIGSYPSSRSPTSQVDTPFIVGPNGSHPSFHMERLYLPNQETFATYHPFPNQWNEGIDCCRRPLRERAKSEVDVVLSYWDGNLCLPLVERGMIGGVGKVSYKVEPRGKSLGYLSIDPYTMPSSRDYTQTPDCVTRDGIKPLLHAQLASYMKKAEEAKTLNDKSLLSYVDDCYKR